MPLPRKRHVSPEELERLRRLRAARPECGAKSRRTGMPCRAIAMANGRCWVHGGAVPKGEGWHRAQWPDKDEPGADRKFVNKAAALRRRERARAEKVAAMSPSERREFERRSEVKRPKTRQRRAAEERRARDLATRDEIDRLLAQPRPAIEAADHQPPIEEFAMTRRTTTNAADALSAARERIREDGAEIAVRALTEIAADPKVPAAARAQAASSLLRAAGLFTDPGTEAAEKEPHEMTAAEIRAEIRRLERAAAEARQLAEQAATGDPFA